MKPSLLGAFKLSAERNWQATKLIMRTLGGLFTRDTPVKQLMGPVAIADLSGQAANAGWLQLFSLVSMISLNLGLLNLMPVPVLDGGHITILALEGLARRDFSIKVKEKICSPASCAADADGHGHLQRPDPAGSGSRTAAPGGNFITPRPTTNSQGVCAKQRGESHWSQLVRWLRYPVVCTLPLELEVGRWKLTLTDAARPLPSREEFRPMLALAGRSSSRARMDHHGHGRDLMSARWDPRRSGGWPRQRAVHRGRHLRMGMLLASTTLVSHAFGAAADECTAGCCTASSSPLLRTIPTTLALFWMSASLDRWGSTRTCCLVRPYLDAVAWSTLPPWCTSRCGANLQGVGVVRPIMITLIAATS